MSIDDVVIEITNKSYRDLSLYKNKELNVVKQIGAEEILYWKSVIQSYNLLTKEEAIARLIRSEKIEEKIQIIQKTITKEILAWEAL